MAETALELKQKGNNAFSAGNFEEAVSHFTAAINLEPVNEVLYCNRSMAYSSLEEWELSVNDAKTVGLRHIFYSYMMISICCQAVQLQSKYEKAYFRLVKGLVSMTNKSSHVLETLTDRICFILDSTGALQRSQNISHCGLQ